MTTPSTMAKASRSPLPSGVEVLGEITPAFSEILTPEALAFVAKLQRQFGARRKQCLERRQERQRRLDQGQGLDFLPETKQIREGDWKCAPIPSDIQDRRVEITGPTDRKMVINALNSGAKIFMADLEDANAPGYDPYDQSGYQGIAAGRGSSVREIQTRLARAGYYRGPIDGVMGPRILYAIRAYQRSHSSRVTAR